MSGVHPTAVIDPTARLGDGVVIGPFAVIGPHVTLGPHCEVGPHAVIEHTTAGAHCRFFPHAFVGTEPQDLKYKGEPSCVRVGDRTTIRECVTVHRGTAASGVTVVGSNCLLMAYVHVAHDCVVGDGVIMANGATLAGHVTVGSGAFVGGLSAVHQFARIGAGAMVGGGARVPKDVAPFTLVQGDRAAVVGLNVVGLRRRGVTRDSLAGLKAAYRTLFHEGLLLEEAVQKITSGPRSGEVDEFLAFLRAPSARGLTRPAAGSADSAEKDFF